jgi:hypothetical protein
MRSSLLSSSERFEKCICAHDWISRFSGGYEQETLERTGAFRANSDSATRLTQMENLEISEE